MIKWIIRKIPAFIVTFIAILLLKVDFEFAQFMIDLIRNGELFKFLLSIFGMLIMSWLSLFFVILGFSLFVDERE